MVTGTARERESLPGWALCLLTLACIAAALFIGHAMHQAMRDAAKTQAQRCKEAGGVLVQGYSAMHCVIEAKP